MNKKDLFSLIGIVVIAIIVSAITSTLMITNSINSLNDGINSLNKSINGQLNAINKTVQANSDANFVKLQTKISTSVVVLLTYPAKPAGGASTTFVDSQGVTWNRGTAFSIDEKGDLFTAYHMIDNESAGKIIFADGTNMTFLINKSNEVNIFESDVAILFVHTHLPPVSLSQLGFLKGVNTGSGIAFIGYPTITVINGSFIPVRTVVKGEIAGITAFPYTSKTALINETLVYYLGGPVNLGNSGGPLFLATTGNVIGIINAKFNDIQNIGVATAINQSMIKYMLGEST